MKGTADKLINVTAIFFSSSTGRGSAAFVSQVFDLATSDIHDGFQASTQAGDRQEDIITSGDTEGSEEAATWGIFPTAQSTNSTSVTASLEVLLHSTGDSSPAIHPSTWDRATVAPPSHPPTFPSDENSWRSAFAAAMVIAVILLIYALVMTLFIVLRWKKKTEYPEVPFEPTVNVHLNSCKYFDVSPPVTPTEKCKNLEYDVPGQLSSKKDADNNVVVVGDDSLDILTSILTT